MAADGTPLKARATVAHVRRRGVLAVAHPEAQTKREKIVNCLRTKKNPTHSQCHRMSAGDKYPLQAK